MLEIPIGDNKISIKDQFTLIKGKFKKEMLTAIQNINFLQNFENFETIPLEEFLNIVNNRAKNLRDLEKSLILLNFLDKYRSLTLYNSDIVDKHTNLIQNLAELLRYNGLIKRKEILKKELRISQIKSNSSDIAAKTDLLNKLTMSLTQSKKQVTYLDEDYLKIKNQKDEFFKELESYNSEIEKLNNQKKDFFNQINKITRGMDEESSNDDNSEFQGLSKSEKIKSLQLNAKDVQFKIKQTNAKLQESQIKLDKINPKYESIEQDYLLKVNMIKNDEEKINDLKLELETSLNANNKEKSIKIDFTKFDMIKPKNQIEDEINSINIELNRIKRSLQYFNNDDTQDISEFKKEIKEINEILTKKETTIIIPQERELIIEIMDSFKNVDILIKKIENITNKFLLEINLKSIFNLIITDNNMNLSINIQFIRSNKESVDFQNLTTPEKIFFILCLYLSIQMQFDSKDIIFSNLFIHVSFNKRGSIFRTIRKLIPIFKNESIFNKYRLIFILSNLELKDEIENLIVVNI